MKCRWQRNSLAVQWLGLWLPLPGLGSALCWRTKIPQATWYSHPKEEKKKEMQMMILNKQAPGAESQNILSLIAKRPKTWHPSGKFGVSGPHKLSHGKDQQGFSTQKAQSGSSAHISHSFSSNRCSVTREALTKNPHPHVHTYTQTLYVWVKKHKSQDAGMLIEFTCW